MTAVENGPAGTAPRGPLTAIHALEKETAVLRCLSLHRGRQADRVRNAECEYHAWSVEIGESANLGEPASVSWRQWCWWRAEVQIQRALLVALDRTLDQQQLIVEQWSKRVEVETR